MTDLYSVLGIQPGSTSAEIRSAYHKLARECHPDRFPGNKQAEERFKAISNAYTVLSDDLKRAKYDHSRMNPAAQRRPAPAHAGRYTERPIYKAEDHARPHVEESQYTPEDVFDAFDRIFGGTGFFETMESRVHGRKGRSKAIKCPMCKGKGVISGRFGPIMVKSSCPCVWGTP